MHTLKRYKTVLIHRFVHIYEKTKLLQINKKAFRTKCFLGYRLIEYVKRYLSVYAPVKKKHSLSLREQLDEEHIPEYMVTVLVHLNLVVVNKTP